MSHCRLEQELHPGRLKVAASVKIGHGRDENEKGPGEEGLKEGEDFVDQDALVAKESRVDDATAVHVHDLRVAEEVVVE